MHLSYYFIQRVSIALQKKLEGWILAESYTQSKGELVLVFRSYQGPPEELHLVVLTTPTFSCLAFPKSRSRASRNSTNQFSSCLGLRIKGISQIEGDRLLLISFHKSDLMLVFKLYGTRSNVLLLKSGRVEELFKKSKPDQLFDLSTIGPPNKVPTLRTFEMNPDLRTHFPHLRGRPEKELEMRGFHEAPIPEKWSLLQNILKEILETDTIYAIEQDQDCYLLLFSPWKVEVSNRITLFSDPLEASTYLFRKKTHSTSINTEVGVIQNSILSQLRKMSKYVHSAKMKLKDMENSDALMQLGDLIMANLHEIPKGAKELKVINFYTNNEVIIPLKTGVSPQKVAEIYYRKAKNQHKEVENIKQNIELREREISRLEIVLSQLKNTADPKKLGEITREFKTVQNRKDGERVKPYSEYLIGGFQVLVGKSAKSNDELLRNHTRKDDYWLHVKDAPGSHVIIRRNRGQSIPTSILEESAQLAAYYSKRKTESLVPVIYTEAKYVRKRKGSPAGAVVVDKEEILLVEPVPQDS